MGWLADPGEIYRRSFEAVRREAPLAGLPDGVADIALRVVHACGMPDIVRDLRWSDDLPEAARGALAAGAPVLCDGAMTAAGISRRGGARPLCMIDAPDVAELARSRGTTRSAAQVELWRPLLPGSVVAVGSAPTALFRLLEVVAEEPDRAPAAILGFAVGFVGAAEAKEALAEARPAPFLALAGRRGGSAMAAAAVNAVLGWLGP